jgi:hypothetical protein
MDQQNFFVFYCLFMYTTEVCTARALMSNLINMLAAAPPEKILRAAVARPRRVF